jgi:hypothetical protein
LAKKKAASAIRHARWRRANGLKTGFERKRRTGVFILGTFGRALNHASILSSHYRQTPLESKRFGLGRGGAFNGLFLQAAVDLLADGVRQPCNFAISRADC